MCELEDKYGVGESGFVVMPKLARFINEREILAFTGEIQSSRGCHVGEATRYRVEKRELVSGHSVWSFVNLRRLPSITAISSGYMIIIASD